MTLMCNNNTLHLQMNTNFIIANKDKDEYIYDLNIYFHTKWYDSLQQCIAKVFKQFTDICKQQINFFDYLSIPYYCPIEKKYVYFIILDNSTFSQISKSFKVMQMKDLDKFGFIVDKIKGKTLRECDETIEQQTNRSDSKYKKSQSRSNYEFTSTKLQIQDLSSQDPQFFSIKKQDQNVIFKYLENNFAYTFEEYKQNQQVYVKITLKNQNQYQNTMQQLIKEFPRIQIIENKKFQTNYEVIKVDQSNLNEQDKKLITQINETWSQNIDKVQNTAIVDDLVQQIGCYYTEALKTETQNKITDEIIQRMYDQGFYDIQELIAQNSSQGNKNQQEIKNTVDQVIQQNKNNINQKIQQQLNIKTDYMQESGYNEFVKAMNQQ